ncbi:MAG: 2-C-methyl-D-erythritol 2,4-cyclodiphosphate synthase [Petrotogales bacterium]
MMQDEELYRVGFGWDVHKISKKKGFLYIGGVNVSDIYFAIAHSDGDALIHSLVDAILGALSEGNIGIMFPSNEKNRNRRSVELLDETVNMLKDKSYRVVNVDSTVIVKEINLKGFLNEIIALLSGKLEVDKNRVSIKPKSGNGVYEKIVMAYTTIMLKRSG